MPVSICVRSARQADQSAAEEVKGVDISATEGNTPQSHLRLVRGPHALMQAIGSKSL